MADKKASLLLKGPIPVKPSTSSMVNYFQVLYINSYVYNICNSLLYYIFRHLVRLANILFSDPSLRLYISKETEVELTHPR